MTGTAGMLDRKLFVALSRLTAPGTDLRPQLAAHLAFMIGLEQRGVLFASGPFYSPDGVPNGAGMSIVRAATLAEAHAILADDPFVVSGLRELELHEWHILEGSLQITVLASQQRGLLP